MEYFDDSLANPIKINVEWQIRRLGNVKPPASSEHQKRHGGNNISSENVIMNGDIMPRIIWVKLFDSRLFCKLTWLWSEMLPSLSPSISGPWSPPTFHHSSTMCRPIVALYDCIPNDRALDNAGISKVRECVACISQRPDWIFFLVYRTYRIGVTKC